MEKKGILLVADRNPYIRKFVQREMSQAGYDVGAAASGFQVLEWVGSGKPLDLLILDPELPDTDGMLLFEQLGYYAPDLPIVVHSLIGGYQKYDGISQVSACVEKSGSSIEQLKDVIGNLFRKIG